MVRRDESEIAHIYEKANIIFEISISNTPWPSGKKLRRTKSAGPSPQPFPKSAVALLFVCHTVSNRLDKLRPKVTLAGLNK
jgi:hypothetical protein